MLGYIWGTGKGVHIPVLALSKVRVYSNRQIETRHMKKCCKFKPDAQAFLDTAMQKLSLSARTYTRILKLSCTIADLEASEDIQSHHVSKAIQYMTLDKGVF